MNCARCKRPLSNLTSVQNGMGPVCFGRSRARLAARQLGPESDYRVVKVDAEQRIVWIVDYDGERSVTNDAEAVVAALHVEHPGYRVIYRDTMGSWDELVHVGGVFRAFKPARDMGVAL